MSRRYTIVMDVLELNKDSDLLVAYNPFSKELQYQLVKESNTKGVVTGAIRSRGFRMSEVTLREDKGAQQTAKLTL